MKRVLFVCVENANRSQMAEAFARMHGGDGVEALSAGSRPSGIVNPKAVRFMAERGYDLATHGSKSLDEVTGNYLFAKEGKPSYTAKIEIRYRQPLAIGEEVVCTGRELKRKGRMVEMQGTICKKDGTLLAECLSKMMIVDETPQPSRKLAAGEGEEE